ncbi:hypothetical protein BH23ACT10_BH23ACT10_20860 [soil metagenome]
MDECRATDESNVILREAILGRSLCRQPRNSPGVSRP